MNPYPLYAGLRRNAPVSQVDPGGLWAAWRPFRLGAQLARMEARLALEALLARFSRMTLGEGPAR